jgi:hypothetical protein
MKNRPLPSPPPVPPASREEAFRFLRGLQEFRPKDDKPINEAAVKDYIDSKSVGSLQGISRRIMMDIMKSPTNDLQPTDDRGKPKPMAKPAKKSSPKAKSKRTPKRSPSKAAKHLRVKKKKAARRT